MAVETMGKTVTLTSFFIAVFGITKKLKGDL
jgi:hypothetical protein